MPTRTYASSYRQADAAFKYKLIPVDMRLPIAIGTFSLKREGTSSDEGKIAPLS